MSKGNYALVWILRAGLAAGCVAMPVACSRSTGHDAASSLTAEMALVRKTNFEITTTASGQLEAKDDLEIRSKVESRTTIVEMVKEGTRVKQGDLLVRLASDQIEKAIVDENARLQSARSDLISAENSVAMQEIENTNRLRKAQLRVDLARSALQQWKSGEVVIRRKNNNVAIEKSQRELKRAQERLVRSEALFAKEFLASEELEKDRIAVIEWTNESEKARIASDVYEQYEYVKDEKTKAGEVADAEADLSRVLLNNEKELVVKKADLENKREQLRIRESNHAKLEDQLNQTVIRAPREGLVVYATSMERGRWDQGALQVGKEVQNNEQLFSLPDTSEMVASVKVHESLAGRVRPGMQASIKVDATGGKIFAGTVDSIGVLAESNGWRDPNLREYTVKIAIAKTEEAAILKPSMRADATIVLGSVEEAVSIPVQAVFNDGSVRFVYISEGNKYIRRPVKLGRRSDVLAEVAAGLDEGQVVLLREPLAGEILTRPWDPEQLKVAGYQLAENGQPVEVGAANSSPRRAARPTKGAPSREAANTPASAPDANTATVAAPPASAPETKPVASPPASPAATPSPASTSAAPALQTPAQTTPVKAAPAQSTTKPTSKR